MKKALCIITTFVMLVSYAFIPNLIAYAANISLGVSASSIQIGDTVTATVSVPENVTGPIYVTFSNDVLEFSNASVKDVGVNGGNINISIGKYGLAGTNKVKLTFKAKTSGTAKLSATHGDLYDDNTFEEVKLGSASTTIKVANKTTNSENGGGGTTTEPQKSADNSLSSLKLSSGTLSPKFKYNVTKYTATVDYDVTKVVVSGKTSNAKAVIESVTGDGTVNLKVGKNTIEVVVRAENGEKATYTIVVTRKAQETTVTPEPQPSESESQSQSESTTPPPVNDTLQWNGEQLQVPETIPTESVPKDFESTSLVVNGQQMPGLSFGKGDLKVLYLNNTNGAGSLYVYDETQQTIYPFIKITSEKSYVMVLVPDEENNPAPAGFESCTFSIEGKGVVNAYQLKEKNPVGAEDATMTWNIFGAETFYAAEPKASDFYLIYCMNDSGEKGWYMYDSVEETFQRYLAVEPEVQTGGDVSDTPVTDDEKYAELEKELKTAKMTQYISMGAAVVLAIIVIVLVVLLIMKKRSEEDDFFNEYEEEDDEYEDDDETVVAESDIYVDTMEDVSEEDEIEIEFYEMEDLIVKEATEHVAEINEKVMNPTSKRSSKEDDDDDLEFIDFE